MITEAFSPLPSSFQWWKLYFFAFSTLSPPDQRLLNNLNEVYCNNIKLGSVQYPLYYTKHEIRSGTSHVIESTWYARCQQSRSQTLIPTNRYSIPSARASSLVTTPFHITLRILCNAALILVHGAQGSSQERFKSIAGGRGLGPRQSFGYHIKEIWILKAWGPERAWGALNTDTVWPKELSPQ